MGSLAVSPVSALIIGKLPVRFWALPAGRECPIMGWGTDNLALRFNDFICIAPVQHINAPSGPVRVKSDRLTIAYEDRIPPITPYLKRLNELIGILL